jgi:hypothetical protein
MWLNMRTRDVLNSRTNTRADLSTLQDGGKAIHGLHYSSTTALRGMGCRKYSSTVLNLNTTCRRVASYKLLALYPREITTGTGSSWGWLGYRASVQIMDILLPLLGIEPMFLSRPACVVAIISTEPCRLLPTYAVCSTWPQVTKNTSGIWSFVLKQMYHHKVLAVPSQGISCAITRYQVCHHRVSRMPPR